MNAEQLNKKLEEIFSLYQATVTNPQQKKIISRGFVYSNVDFSADFLICGFNPSERSGFLDTPVSYTYQLLHKDRYFKKFHPFFINKVNDSAISYFDLFYHKHSKQVDISTFKVDKTGLDFLQDQLYLTKEVLEQIQPKAIFIFNRQAFDFFSYYQAFQAGLNLELKKTELPNTFCIQSGKLKNTLVYASRFLNHFVKPEEIQKIKKEVHDVLRRASYSIQP